MLVAKAKFKKGNLLIDSWLQETSTTKALHFDFLN